MERKRYESSRINISSRSGAQNNEKKILKPIIHVSGPRNSEFRIFVETFFKNKSFDGRKLVKTPRVGISFRLEISMAYRYERIDSI